MAKGDGSGRPRRLDHETLKPEQIDAEVAALFEGLDPRRATA